MCGIVGGYSPDEGAFWRGKLNAATASLAHRGPDAQGVFQEGPVGLGHRRLSILDLSEAANQPLHDASGQYVLIFNGEIFNYRVLAQQLPAGTQLRNQSDTEVLLHMLIREGAACLPKLNGFFALAFYDCQASRLLLARDRYGIKPLHLYQADGHLLFASELQALLALGIPRKLRANRLRLYLQLSYLPAEQGWLEGCRKLAPGHWLQVGPKGVEEQCWYTLPVVDAEQPAAGMPSYEAACQGVFTRLEAAVQRRLVADVPVGVFLSGGLDSSVVAALAARHHADVPSFSIGFEDKLYDETHYAQAVAQKIGSRHTVFRLSMEELYANLERVLASLDEPFADASLINVFVLSEYTRQHVTVALSGDGADEMLAGYNKHAAEYRAQHPGAVGSLVQLLGPLLKAVPASRNSQLGRKLLQAQRFASESRLGGADRYATWASHTPEALAQALVPEGLTAGHLLPAELRAPLDEAQGLNATLRADFALVLPGDMLKKVDHASMAHALEVRPPFLDYELVDYCFALPSAYKINNQLRKRLLQDAFRPLLPPELYNRPKQGFEIPLRQWFTTSLRGYIEREVLDRDFIEAQGLFSYAALQALWQRVLAGRNHKEDWTLWAVVVFQHWYRRTF